MKIIYLFIFAILLFSLVRCKKAGNCNTIIATGVNISYVDQNGNDLLDPATDNYFSESRIKAYRIIDGREIEVYNGLMDHPRDFHISQNMAEGRYNLTLSLNSDSMSLRLNEKICDTITGVFDSSHGNIVVKEIYYNGALKWKFDDGAPSFTIQK